ncbi:MAG: Gfo/Idh/MocA family oxidoreductase [Clostridiales bacterium]|nr:Gfo/Idh/MocA family oxidoreductase [Clostridiales bacterium]
MVRIGVIGIGKMGSAHAVSIFEQKVEGMRLSAVCDISPEKRSWAAEQLNDQVYCYSSYRELLSSGNCDAVLIAVPHRLHPVIACEAFQAGLHVLTEKPSGIDTKSVKQMNKVAHESGKVFGIMYNQRTNPLYRSLREMVRSGDLGELKRMVWIISNWYRTQYYYDSGDWRGTWGQEGGGVLMNQCPHNLDLWQWIMGMPSSVRAVCHKGKFHRISVEDDVTIYAEYPNGASAVFIASTGECPGTNRLEISGTKGKAVVENGCLSLYLLEKDEREICFQSKQEMPNEPVEIRHSH